MTLVDPGDGGMAVRLADGRCFHARAVISTLDPITTFGELMGPARAGEALSAVAGEWVLDPAGSFIAQFGIKGSPPPDDGAVVRVLGFASVADVDAHLEAVAAGELPARPAGHLTVTTRHDPLQASPGPYGPLHTLRYESPAPSVHPAQPWDRARVAYRQRCWEMIGCGELPLFQFADTPQDLEHRFGTARRGSLRQGSLRVDQTLSGRPHPSCATGRTPIPGLYLGGGGVHPGVPGSLAGGYNAAGLVCDDLGLERWW